jgi:ABC-2 type transport system permease protein
VRTATILLGKNIAAAIFVLLEITAVASVCILLRMPVSPGKLVESYCVTLILTMYLLAVGNLGSTHFPRPVNPTQSWRSASAGRFQALLMFLYPVVSIPVVLAYAARYAFDSDVAFYAVLLFAAGLGAMVYWVAMESAVSCVDQNREKILLALSQGEGPVAA